MDQTDWGHRRRRNSPEQDLRGGGVAGDGRSGSPGLGFGRVLDWKHECGMGNPLGHSEQRIRARMGLAAVQSGGGGGPRRSGACGPDWGKKNYCQSVRVHVLSECKPEPASRGSRCALQRISPRRRMARAAEERRWPCTGGKGTLRPRLTSVTGAGERVGAHRAFEPKKKGRRRARRRRPAARWAQTSWSSRRRAPQDSWSPRIGSTGPCGDDAGDQRCRSRRRRAN